MTKRKTVCLCVVILLLISACPVYAGTVPQADTPNYKVAFYAFDCYHMQDADGKKYGYGYEMMQNISKYMQGTFSYVGYDKTAQECEEMLRNGEIDIQTATKITPERQKEFTFTRHPAITANTCMNVKVGNTKVVAGDYATYEGLRVGLLRRHTYNEAFEQFAEEKGFSCEIVYYDTPTELTSALIHDEVDALVNSYIRTPEDERVIENFGETPYYIMARKEDQALIDQIDASIDQMNIETPNWRTDLYDRYYGSQSQNTEYTSEELALLEQMKNDQTVIRAVMNPDANPYAWFDEDGAHGIAVDIFAATADKLGLGYEIVSVSSRAEYENMLAEGAVDIWMDVTSPDGEICESGYRVTDPYLTTTVSMLHQRGFSGKMKKIVVAEDNIEVRRIIEETWEDAQITILDNLDECVKAILRGDADGAFLMTYTAQKLAQKNIQNQLSVAIVPGAQISLRMGVLANDDYHFYGLWEKTLALVATQDAGEIVQNYIEENADTSMVGYLYDHPMYLILILVLAFMMMLFVMLYVQAVHSRKRQQQISAELSAALEQSRQATEAKQNFFSKMSHDIRTPLNVVLGMTQIAQKYKHDENRLGRALESITTEGNYLLVMINSILDVNQLEYGHVELLNNTFYPAECMRNSVEVLRPLADKKEQRLLVYSDCDDRVVVGDSNRFSQIMINIVSNAIKYTDNGGLIEVRLEAVGDGRYRFSCKDNGIGMTADFVQHISEDYVRAEDSRVSKNQGTGLGMSVVKGFTELMDGSLRITSEPGVGSTFTVELPFAAASEAQIQELRDAEYEEQHNSIHYVGKKVLLVEDNALNAEIATELLQTIGLEVDWAENGQAGVDEFEKSRPNEYFAVFMDMQMPVMDGIEATKAIRGSARDDSDLPIFAMTANTFASDRKKCQAAGMDGYISKPVNVNAIKDALKKKKSTFQ